MDYDRWSAAPSKNHIVSTLFTCFRREQCGQPGGQPVTSMRFPGLYGISRLYGIYRQAINQSTLLKSGSYELVM